VSHPDSYVCTLELSCTFHDTSSYTDDYVRDTEISPAPVVRSLQPSSQSWCSEKKPVGDKTEFKPELSFLTGTDRR